MMLKRMRWMLWAVTGVPLVACGGGEGEQSSNPPPVVTRPPANRALTISIPPSSNVLVGRQLTVTPTASDPDGDPLTFLVSNRPAWLSFSAQTGVLTGTPGTGAVGSYPNIQIKVSDGTLQASLAAFSIAVQQSASGTATLRWTAPTMRADGSPLTNLAGYKVRYGNAAGDYPTTITLSNPGITSYMVEDLSSGTYFFVLASYDSTGLESANSIPASKTIPKDQLNSTGPGRRPRLPGLCYVASMDDDSTPSAQVPFATLSPDAVVDAVEAAGFRSDGRVLALGSYENRVFQVGREDADPVVIKFYRPGRWTDEAIAEEHAFARQLAAAEIPVIAPLEPANCEALGCGPVPVFGGFRIAIYPRRGGQWPELGTPDDRQWIGRFLGRIHMVGAAGRFVHRGRLSVDGMGRQSVDYLLDSDRMADYIADRYDLVSGELLDLVEARFEAAGPLRQLRIHGDCHRNNVLWTSAGPHFVDLDDCMTGPAIQDLWMLLAGNAAEMRAQLADILEGYSQFANFDPVEIMLIEPLRSLRMIHYAAWLARRWHDPAFPLAFPWFGEVRYWERHVAELEEQLMTLEQS